MRESAVAADSGLEVIDLRSTSDFAARPARPRSMAAQLEGLHRIARAFVQTPTTILQELVEVAVELCGADSAGISLERENRTDEHFYEWVAVAGEYNGFLRAVLPRYPSACGICLDRGAPQLFRVSQPFFDHLGIEAPPVRDGLLLPWQVEETRGTIFVMAHSRAEAFDSGDWRLMQVLADFAALGVRQHKQQARLLEQATAAAAAAMANDLAHQINNPLQSLTNILYLAAEGHYGEDAKSLGREASGDLQRLSLLVSRLLSLPRGAAQ